MKLLVFVCVCALAAAEQQESAPTAGQLAIGLGHLYRRFLHVAAPKQLKLQDALDIKWRKNTMMGPPFRSAVKGTFEGEEKATFSFANSLVNPGQKGIFNSWTKNDASDVVMTYHYGGAAKIHMVTEGGIHKEVILGNALDHGSEHAKFVVVIPKTTYAIFESLSEDHASFISYMSIPAWDPASSHFFSQKEMEGLFPDFAEMFHELSKEGVHHKHHDDDHHDDEHDDDDDHKHGRHSHDSHHRH